MGPLSVCGPSLTECLYVAHDCTWYVIVFRHDLDGDFMPGSGSSKSYSAKAPF